MKSFTGIAALVAVLLVPSTAAQAQLPVGEADGVRMVAQRGGVLVIFTARAEKLRRRYAGKVLEISCTDFVEGGANIFGEGLRVPRHRHRVFAGDHPRGTDYCRLWRPERTVKRRRGRVVYGRELLVSVPLTQQGAVYLDEEETTQGISGVLVIASLSDDGEELGRYRTYDELIAKYPKAARAVVELDAPGDSPPAGKIGFYSDGAAHVLVAALSASGRRLFIEYEGERGIPTRASLIELYAGMARDQAVLIAGLAGIQLQGVEELDHRIIEAKAAIARDFDAAERES